MTTVHSFMKTIWRCDNCGANFNGTCGVCADGGYPVPVNNFDFEAAKAAGLTFESVGNVHTFSDGTVVTENLDGWGDTVD